MTLELLAELALLKEQNAQLVKERDAAVAEIHWLIVSWFTTGKINVCKICCNYNDGNHNNECKNCHTLCPYSNFSWRGVQNE